jgi:hypothetical protein
VVEVLLAARRVHTGGLQVPERIRADPDVLPRRRDPQLANACEHFRLVDPVAILVEVLEALPAPTTRDTRA